MINSDEIVLIKSDYSPLLSKQLLLR